MSKGCKRQLLWILYKMVLWDVNISTTDIFKLICPNFAINFLALLSHKVPYVNCYR